MAETDFILNREEQHKLVEFMLDQNVDFVPSLDYAEPKIEVLNSSEQILAMVEQRVLTGTIFLPFVEDKPYNFELRRVRKLTGEVIYYISERVGTPCLDLMPCQYMFVKHNPYVASGSMSYYRSYFVGPNYDEEVEVPEKVKDLYKLTQKFLRTIAKRYSSGKGIRYYWVGHKAREELLGGVSTNVPNLHL